MCRIVVPETPGFKEALERVDYRTRDVLSYVLRNSTKPVAYCRRCRNGQAISSAMAESAVNQVIKRSYVQTSANALDSTRRPLLAQVRCAVLNGDAAESVARLLPRIRCQSSYFCRILFGLTVC
jgi:hypothetical protein